MSDRFILYTETGSHASRLASNLGYVAKVALKLSVLFFSHLECWYLKHMLTHLFYAMLAIELRDLVVLKNYFTNCVTFSVPDIFF